MSEAGSEADREIVLVYTTWPDAKTAEAAGAAAVAERLAACANVLAPMRSIYRWKGAVEAADETPMLLKTRRALTGRLKDFLVARHPYELPAVVALPVCAAASHAPFVDWVAAETESAGPSGS
jgi:periplasmic divalent cation tolerance protein